MDEHPLENFKVLCGTGAQRYDPVTKETRRVGGVRYTIKDGVVYDAKALLREVADRVERANAETVNAAAPVPE